MRKKDFDFEANAGGYKIYYKHRFVFSYSNGKGHRGAIGHRAKKKYTKMAKAEIDAMYNGWGNEVLATRVREIDEAYARLVKRFGGIK